MSCNVVYLMAGDQPDQAIEKGLTEAGCAIRLTRSIADAMASLKAMRDAGETSLLVVAEIQAGGIPLLALLEEQRVEVSAILMFDRDGSDIHTVIRALKYGASDYLLGSDPDFQREIRARILAERAGAQPASPAREAETSAMSAAPGAASASSAELGFRWDPDIQFIFAGNSYLRLSPIESRLFDLLLSRRNSLVLLDELIAAAFNQPDMDVKKGVKLLRPHIMRLRGKLERFPETARRIVNLRGTGYMFI